MAKLVVHAIGGVLLITKRGRLLADAEECTTLSEILKHVGVEDSLELTPKATLLLKNIYERVNH